MHTLTFVSPRLFAVLEPSYHRMVLLVHLFWLLRLRPNRISLYEHVYSSLLMCLTPAAMCRAAERFDLGLIHTPQAKLIPDGIDGVLGADQLRRYARVPRSDREFREVPRALAPLVTEYTSSSTRHVSMNVCLAQLIDAWCKQVSKHDEQI